MAEQCTINIALCNINIGAIVSAFSSHSTERSNFTVELNNGVIINLNFIKVKTRESVNCQYKLGKVYDTTYRPRDVEFFLKEYTKLNIPGEVICIDGLGNQRVKEIIENTNAIVIPSEKEKLSAPKIAITRIIQRHFADKTLQIVKCSLEEDINDSLDDMLAKLKLYEGEWRKDDNIDTLPVEEQVRYLKRRLDEEKLSQKKARVEDID